MTEDGAAMTWVLTKRRSPWRIEVQRRVLALSGQVEALDPSHRRVELLRHGLRSAWDLADRASGPLLWWNGTLVEQAWGYLREVEQEVAVAASEERLPALVADAESHAWAYLPKDDPIVRKLRTLAAAKDKPYGDATRDCAVSVLRRAHQLADRNHLEARAFRNRLLLGALCLAMFAGLIVLGAWTLKWNVVSDSATGSEYQAVLVVMVLGSLGALIGSIPSLTRLPKETSPFNLPLPLTLLKVVLGALSAFLGLALLRAGFLGVQATSQAVSQAGVATLAVVFGAGQQAVTRFLNLQAKRILNGTSIETQSQSEASDDA